MGYGAMDARDWENACDNIRNNNAVLNNYKEDAEKAHQNLPGYQFWGIAKRYGISDLIEQLLR
ncbi:MAG: hypothetical protein NC541_11650 [bacterium]|nr:hypothetical protein [bacterium]